MFGAIPGRSSNIKMPVIMCGEMPLDLSLPRIMAVLNVTPDSFSDGGRFNSLDLALAQARRLVADGATIVDVGGESTRPGARNVSIDAELERVVPVVEAIRNELPVIISIDTHKPEVMQEAVKAGAGMINDVCALQTKGALDVAVQLDVPVCLMHMQGAPRSMQHDPQYKDVVLEVKSFLKDRIAACLNAGMGRDKLIIDPGFGFGKTVQHNLTLLKNLPEFSSLGYPLLVGLSRKSMIGAMLDKPVENRLFASLGLAALAVWQGASIIRVHDVASTLDVLRVSTAVRNV